MTNILRDLLDAEEPFFSIEIDNLERASGRHGIDVKLIGDLAASFAAAVTALGLDPADSTGREIYAALMNRVNSDNQRIEKSFGITKSTSVAKTNQQIVDEVQKLSSTKNVWVLKRSAAKRLLRMTPPTKLMKVLGYRSVDSMLRRENVDELLILARIIDDEWLEIYNKSFRDVAPSDFEIRDVKVISLSGKIASSLAENFIDARHHAVAHNKELGVVALLPSADRNLTLKTLVVALHYINEICVYSAYFKLKQVKKNFGQILANSLSKDVGEAAHAAGQKIHWRIIQRYFGTLEVSEYSLSSQPYVQIDDILWRGAEVSLVEIDPEMKFWQNLGWVGRIYDGKPLAFDVIDAVFGLEDGVSYENRYFKHFREALSSEIFVRYLGSKVLRDQVIRQIDETQ